MRSASPVFCLLLCIFIANDSRLAAEDQLKGVARDNFHLFLLAGQSNMVGLGKVNDADRVPHPRIFMLNAKNEWVPAIDPLHFVDAGKAGTGLGKTFALSYAADHPDVTIGLIPCAIGGTPIEEWQPGAFDERTQTHPWDDAIARSKVALASGTLKGILWHQGEGDATPERSQHYSDRLRGIVTGLRSELQAPNVPFILGELGRFRKNAGSEPYQIVMKSMHEMSETLPLCQVVSSEGLTHIGDRSHFDADSQREFGRRYYAAFQRVERTPQRQATNNSKAP